MEPKVLYGKVPPWLDGSGDGYGDGSGSGHGYGYGSGDGSGSGAGSGSGYGDGSGSGSGYGYGPYFVAAIESYATRWPPKQRQRLAALREQGALIAYWRSDRDGH